MRASTIVTIIVRLFAIHWAVSALMGLISVMGYTASASAPLDSMLSFWVEMLAAPTCYMLLAFGAWFFARHLAWHVVAPSDPEVGLVSLSARDLYGFGVLFIGLTSFLSHLAPIINWIHYLVIHRAGDALVSGRDGLSLYDVTKEAIPCVGGAIIAVYAPRIGERMARPGAIQSKEAAM